VTILLLAKIFIFKILENKDVSKNGLASASGARKCVCHNWL